jgi:hypothetical protein
MVLPDPDVATGTMKDPKTDVHVNVAPVTSEVKLMFVDDELQIVSVIGFENAGMTDAFVNPANFPVLPTDPHIEHATGHLQDMMMQIQSSMQSIQAGQPDIDELGLVVRSIQFKGGHIMAHVEYISKDESKQDFLKQFMQGMNEAQAMADELQQVYVQILIHHVQI